jgi:hypothetical protein
LVAVEFVLDGNIHRAIGTINRVAVGQESNNAVVFLADAGENIRPFGEKGV